MRKHIIKKISTIDKIYTYINYLPIGSYENGGYLKIYSYLSAWKKN